MKSTMGAARRLRADAEGQDPENVLCATVLTSDVGKLYQLLAALLERMW